ncbi:hypothetical protein GCM10009855_27990 [Gordonia cholesterolivorans]|uniref:Uncharacterized protein n=1 Tax=Gordonia cholesterolivorans TaxID=559625 RepID=A0ABN3HRD1_9ACTN
MRSDVVVFGTYGNRARLRDITSEYTVTYRWTGLAGHDNWSCDIGWDTEDFRRLTEGCFSDVPDRVHRRQCATPALDPNARVAHWRASAACSPHHFR